MISLWFSSSSTSDDIGIVAFCFQNRTVIFAYLVVFSSFCFQFDLNVQCVTACIIVLRLHRIFIRTSYFIWLNFQFWCLVVPKSLHQISLHVTLLINLVATFRLKIKWIFHVFQFVKLEINHFDNNSVDAKAFPNEIHMRKMFVCFSIFATKMAHMAVAADFF